MMTSATHLRNFWLFGAIFGFSAEVVCLAGAHIVEPRDASGKLTQNLQSRAQVKNKRKRTGGTPEPLAKWPGHIGAAFSRKERAATYSGRWIQYSASTLHKETKGWNVPFSRTRAIVCCDALSMAAKMSEAWQTHARTHKQLNTRARARAGGSVARQHGNVAQVLVWWWCVQPGGRMSAPRNPPGQ